MPSRRFAPTFAAILASVLVLPRHASAQGSIADRLKKIADEEKKSLVADANRQVNSAIQDAAAAQVADGSFAAAFSPWSSSDGSKRVEIARYGGSAFAVTTTSGRQIILCDDKGALAWSASFTILDKAPAGVGGAGRGGPAPATGRQGGPAPSGTSPASAGGRSNVPGAPASGRGTGVPPTTTGRGGSAGAPGTGATAGGADRGGGGGGGSPSPGSRCGGGRGGTAPGADSGRGGAASNAAAAPTADEREYRFPSPLVTVTLPRTGPRIGAPGSGSIRVGDVSDDIFVGAAKIRFNQVPIPGERTPQIVDFGVAFKARVIPPSDQPAGCAVLTAGKTTVASGRGAPPPGARTAPDPAARPAAGAPPAAGTTPAAGGTAFAEGDVLTPKIGSINLLAEAQDSARVSVVLKRGDELVYLGEEKSGYIRVSIGTAEGWVRKVLVVKR